MPLLDIWAQLPYLAPHCGALHTYACEPPNGTPRFNGRLQGHAVLLRDIRGAAQAPSLAVEGFELCEQYSRVRDFWDEEQIRSVHYPEARELALALTGGVDAVVFDHTLRRRDEGRPPLDGLGGSFSPVRSPVGRVHADYTPRSGPERFSALRRRHDVDALDDTPFMILGLWRPLNEGPLNDAPLAMMDARTLAPADLVPNDLIYADRRGQTYAITYSPGHRWHHLQGQWRHEVLAFVHYDSEAATADGATGAAAHTAFEHPGTPANAEPRQSVELRVLVIKLR
ncbi:MAG: CmcJ/NvfI family oxidoreductase [Rhodoferax sp.]